MESRSVKPRPPGSLQPLAGEEDEGQQGWDRVRAALVTIGAEKGEWAGCPLPHDDLRLVIEPRYPFQKLNGARFNKDAGPDEAQMKSAAELVDFSKGNIFLKNAWETPKGELWVYHHGDNRSKFCIIPKDTTAMNLVLNTLAASQVWKLDAEIKACEKLRGLITPRAYRYYILTGTFLETSPRSQVTYLFRKLRPTIALSPRPNGLMNVLACLCLHPIGFYEKSYAGVMVPTDDVLSHLLMMRADERKFWAKANHHSPDDPAAGIS